MLLNLRRQSVSRGDAPAGEGRLFSLWAWIMRRPGLYRLALRLARLGQMPFARRGWLGKLPPPLHNWTQSRDFKAVAPQSFRDRWQATLQYEKPSRNGAGGGGHEC